jgi:flagellar motility protein MotE (MotC chaperone)
MQPTTAPATAPADLAAASATQAAPAEFASASDRIAYAQHAIEQERLRLDRDAQDLQNRQKLLESQSKEVDARLAEVAAQRKKFEAEVAAHSAQTHDASFDRMLELYGELKPQQVKDFFMAMDPNLVASYLRAMDTDQSSRIIAQFQTEDEKTFILGVLSKLRTSGTTSALADSATQPNSPARAGQARN